MKEDKKKILDESTNRCTSYTCIENEKQEIKREVSRQMMPFMAFTKKKLFSVILRLLQPDSQVTFLALFLSLLLS